MFRFMAYCLGGQGGVGLQHVGGLVNDKVMLVENYQAPCDMTVNGRDVPAETWLQGYHARDEGVWGDVKKGIYRGVSIQGKAVVIPG